MERARRAFRGWRGVLAAISCAALSGAEPLPRAATRVSRTVFSHHLPTLDGDHLEISLVEVAYGPGGSSAPHSHPCPVIGYVVEGAVRTQVKGEAEAVYRTGESFYEAPNGTHLVSANA